MKKKMRLYCTCGAAWTGSPVNDAVAKSIKDCWDSIHSGGIHQPTSAEGARRARAKAEKERQDDG